MSYTVTRKQIADAALSLRGVRFRHQGRSAETGVDCAGFIYVVLTRVDYPNIVDVEGYKATPSATLIYDTFLANFDEIPLADVDLGDIYLMKIGGANPKHCSIVVNTTRDIENGIEPMIAHAYGSGDTGHVKVEKLGNWKTRCVTGFRLRGLVN